MYATSTTAKAAAFVFSVLMSVAVLGATAIGMDAAALKNDEVLTLDRTIVSAAPGSTAVN